MGVSPEGQPPQTRFSADGFWWWSGAEWKPAISPDRQWRWNGQTWVPATTAGGGGGGVGLAIGLTVLAFVGVLVVVAGIVILIIFTMGNQFANILSNVAIALGSPSP